MLVDHKEYKGCRVEIHYDECSYDMNPRSEECNLTRFAFQPHRNYEVPNEIDFPFGRGDGCDLIDEAPEDGGIRDDETRWEWFCRTLTEQHGALAIYKVGMIDHSGVSYYMGGGPAVGDSAGWDSGTCGVVIVTQEGVDECGTPPELWEQCAREEIERYGQWANGEVYYVRAVDPDGDTIECVGGYIGFSECEADMYSEGESWCDSFLSDREDAANNLAADAMVELLAVAG